MRRVCVFCGSSPGRNPLFVQAAREVGGVIARAGLGLVYGGGGNGMMGAVADGALDAGGQVTGIIPDALRRRELAHPRVADMQVVQSMHERKQAMADASDAFMMLPGGFGTFEEFCEVVTWSQLGMHRKPCVLLNVAGYFDRMIAMFDHAREEEFVSRAHRAIVAAVDAPTQLVQALRDYRAPPTHRWLAEEDT
ncbi:MAG: TIGR00730 family Rossman fold protein [Betaproteobacteria bacterium]|nr:TIGR00730 family Rossman fold protein [Betaproteobacteria bacterium]